MFLVVRLLVRRSCMGFFSCRRKCGILRLRECGIGSEQQGREHIEGEFFFLVLSCVKPPWELSSREEGVFFFLSAWMRGWEDQNMHLDILILTFCPFFFLLSKTRTGHIDLTDPPNIHFTVHVPFSTHLLSVRCGTVYRMELSLPPFCSLATWHKTCYCQ